MAEIGVALLLFTLGIGSHSKDSRTAHQVLLGIGLGYGVGQMLGLDWLASLWFGVALGPSNTMIIIGRWAANELLGTLNAS